jgi:cytochrome c
MDGNGSYLGYRNIDLTGIASFTVNALGNMRGANAGGTIEIRMDSPEGTLLGKSEVINATQRGPVTAKIAIPETKGQHDLYFVFVNPQAKTNQTLVQLTGIDIAAR